MARPTGKLLDLLDLLQSRGTATGPQIAQRLEVDRRTVRRYVAALQDLGIPVEGERGVAGGYRLRPGYRLPPLMLDDNEAAAVVLGLAAARRLGLGDANHVDAAIAKLRRVLPPALGRRVAALDRSLEFIGSPSDAPVVAGGRLLELADAVQGRRRLTLRYRSHAGEETEREVSPHGLVAHAGRWYLAAFDHGREEARTFRVDRVLRLVTQAETAVPAPEGFDPAEHVAASLARVPWHWEVEVLLELPVAEARTRVAPTLAELTAEGERTRLVMRVESLDFMASVLAGLGCAFAVRRPHALRAAVRAFAARLAQQAGDDGPG